jgi:hypothetical protein
VTLQIIVEILIACAAIYGIVWAYPKLPAPFNLVLVIVVVIVCVVVLLSISGVAPLRLS